MREGPWAVGILSRRQGSGWGMVASRDRVSNESHSANCHYAATLQVTKAGRPAKSCNKAEEVFFIAHAYCDIKV